MPRNSAFHDEAEFYKRWNGKRAKVTEFFSESAISTLESLIEAVALGYDYFGPIAGSRHAYETEREKRLRMTKMNWERARRRGGGDEYTRLPPLPREVPSEIEVCCRACGHIGHFLWTRSQRARAAGKRFSCSECGAKSAPFVPRF